jgi:hypothetical protein
VPNYIINQWENGRGMRERESETGKRGTQWCRGKWGRRAELEKVRIEGSLSALLLGDSNSILVCEFVRESVRKV